MNHWGTTPTSTEASRNDWEAANNCIHDTSRSAPIMMHDVGAREDMKVMIYLFGPAGCGKLTISKKICELCPSLKLIHNHHVNNVILDIVNPDGKTKLPKYVWDNVALVRRAVLSTVKATDRNEGYIFTT